MKNLSLNWYVELASHRVAIKWTTCASFCDAPGYGTQTDGRHFRLESEPGRGRSSGANRDWRGG